MGYVVDAKFVRPFVDATVETLKVQCQLEAKVGKPFMKGQETGGGLSIAIAGVIGVTSPSFMGSISICFPEKTFLGVVGKMLGETFTQITPEIEDGVAELTNIIFGVAKRSLNDNGHAIEKALPSVICGSGLRVKTLTAVPVVILPFMTEAGEFQIEVGIEPIAAQRAA